MLSSSRVRNTIPPSSSRKNRPARPTPARVPVSAHGFEPTAPPRTSNAVPPHRPLPENVSSPSSRRRSSSAGASCDVYNESLRRREGAPPYVFYEGPPTANGRPGTHHVLARVFKDVFPRYKTMRGFYAYRKGGWDSHGLPVEIAVQKQLGIDDKQEIEEYGIAEFNAKCRESVFEYLEDWTEADRADRLLGRPRRPLPHAGHRLRRVGLVGAEPALAQGPAVRGPQGRPVLPARTARRCPSHEVSQGYKDVEDPSVFVRYPVNKPHGELRDGRRPARLDDDALDARVQRRRRRRPRPHLRAHDQRRGARGRGARHRVVGEDAQVVDRFKGAELVGARYEPPFAYIPAPEYGDNGHTVLPADFVTADDGTGIVHTAIAFGEDDFAPRRASTGLAVDQPGPARRHLRRAHRRLRRALRQGRRRGPDRGPRGAAAACTAPRSSTSTPTRTAGAAARRCSTTPSRPGTSAPRRSRTACSRPTRASTGTRSTSSTAASATGSRTTSTGRCAASATGARRCRSGADEDGRRPLCIGSFAELKELSGGELDDPHRPFVDDVTIPSPTGGEPHAARPRGHRRLVRLGVDAVRAVARAVREPGQVRASSSRRTTSARRIDQTRGWFYSLLAIGTLLFDKTARTRRACASAHPRRSDRQEDVEVARQHRRAVGRHRPRTAPTPSAGTLATEAAVGRLPLRHRHGRRVAAPVPAASSGTRTRSTSCTPNVNDVAPLAESRRACRPTSTAGRCRACSATRSTSVTRAPGRTTTPRAPARRSQAFVDDLSNWYVRRSRRRFWDGDPRRFATLRTALVAVTTAARAVRPVHRRRDLQQPRRRPSRSVHLCDWPEAGERDEALELAMATARETVRLGLAARGQAKLKVRQPLRAAVVVRLRGAEREAIERLADVAARRAQRQGAALRLAGRRARLLRGQAQLPRARSALRQADAAGRGRRGGARPGARRRRAAGRRARSGSTSTATSTSSAATT